MASPASGVGLLGPGAKCALCGCGAALCFACRDAPSVATHTQPEQNGVRRANVWIPYSAYGDQFVEHLTEPAASLDIVSDGPGPPTWMWWWRFGSPINVTMYSWSVTPFNREAFAGKPVAFDNPEVIARIASGRATVDRSRVPEDMWSAFEANIVTQYSVSRYYVLRHTMLILASICGVASLAHARRWRHAELRRRRRESGCCVECGYPIGSGVPSVCPECGAACR